jgi:hypothetical protein
MTFSFVSEILPLLAMSADTGRDHLCLLSGADDAAVSRSLFRHLPRLPAIARMLHVCGPMLRHRGAGLRYGRETAASSYHRDATSPLALRQWSRAMRQPCTLRFRKARAENVPSHTHFNETCGESRGWFTAHGVASLGAARRDLCTARRFARTGGPQWIDLGRTALNTCI